MTKLNLAKFAVLSFVVLMLGCTSEPASDTSATDSIPSVTMSGEHASVAIKNATEFNDVVMQSDKPVLVDFWASWCGPCMDIAPAIEQLAVDYEGKAIVAKVDTDLWQDSPNRFGFDAIPTMIIFKDGEEIERITGGMQGSETLNGFRQRLARLLDAAM